MIRSTLSISAVLAVVAVVLTSLWVAFGPRPQGSQDKRTAANFPISQQERSGLDPTGQSIRTITPGSSSRISGSAPAGTSPSATAPNNQVVRPTPSPEPSPSEPQADSASTTGTRTNTAPGSASEASPTTGGSIDLNTASIEQLNGLGAGMIGKRIVEFRPYTSADELLTRRVLKRADYDTIKNSITVR